MAWERVKAKTAVVNDSFRIQLGEAVRGEKVRRLVPSPQERDYRQLAGRRDSRPKTNDLMVWFVNRHPVLSKP